MQDKKLKELKFEDLDVKKNQIIRIVYPDNRSEYVAIFQKEQKSICVRPLITLNEYKLDGQSTTYLNLDNDKIKMYPLTSKDEEIVDMLLKKAEEDLNEQRLKHITAIEELGVIKFKIKTLKKVKE